MAVPRPDIDAFLNLFTPTGQVDCWNWLTFRLTDRSGLSVTSLFFRCVNAHLVSRTDVKGLLVTFLDSDTELRVWFDEDT
jgi:hypothetical protein